MKITDVRAIPIQVPLAEPTWSATDLQMNPALRRTSTREVMIVEVETDTGLVGIGQALASPGPAVTTVTVIERELKTYLVGEDPEYPEKLWDRIYRGTVQHGRRGIIIAALSGIDIAIWDLLGKHYGQPVYKLLGAFRDQVPAYASAGWYRRGKDNAALAEEMRGLVAKGWRAMKMKIGGMTPAEDLARIRAARDAIGPEIALMVDANRSYDVKTAIRMAHAMEELDIAFFEEPVSPDDIDGSARVAAATSIAIAGYETEVTRFAYRELIVRHAVDVVQADAIWAGGFTECRRIAAMAGAFGLTCTPHSFGSPLTVIINAHLVASLPNGGGVEVDCTGNPLMDVLLHPAPRFAGGMLSLPGGPGLGIELNREFIAANRVA